MHAFAFLYASGLAKSMNAITAKLSYSCSMCTNATLTIPLWRPQVQIGDGLLFWPYALVHMAQTGCQ